VIELDIAVAGIAIEPKRGECFCSGINRRCVTSSAEISKTILVPSWFVRVNPFYNLPIVAEFTLSIEYREFAVPIFLQQSKPMAAPHEVFDLRGDWCQRRLVFEYVFPFSSVFALANGDTVCVLLPGRADLVPMAEETFIAMEKLRDWLTHVVTSPRGRVDGLLDRSCFQTRFRHKDALTRLWGRLRSHTKKDRQKTGPNQH